MKTTKVVLPSEMQNDLNEFYQMKIEKIQKAKELLMPKYEEELTYLHDAQKNFDLVNHQMQTLNDEIKSIEEKMNRAMGIDGKDILNKPKKATQQIFWLPYINQVIKKADRFLSFEEIWKGLEENPEVVEKADKTAMGFKWNKTAVEKSMDKHSMNPPVIKRWYVAKYENKYGLPEWVHHNGKTTKLKDAKRAVEFQTIEQPASVIKIAAPKGSKPVKPAKSAIK